MLLLVACSGPDDPGTPPEDGPCVAASAEQHATGTAIRTASPGCGQVDLGAIRALGDGAFQVDLFTSASQVLARVKSLEDGAVLRGLAMAGTAEVAGDEALRVWSLGRTSSSPAGVADAIPIELGADGLPAAPSSSWAALAGRADGASVLVGVHTARASSFAVTFADDGALSVVWGNDGEAVPLDEGDYVWMDALYTSIGPDPQALWRGWADAVALASEATPSAAPPPVTVVVDGGEDAVGEALAALRTDAAPDRAPVGELRIGPGWERAWGDWSAGDAFPSGTAAAADRIGADGLVAGLWLAPFLVDRGTEAYAAHPDWWVRDDVGELDRLGHAVLDATHPDAAAWLADVIAARADEGFGVLALDHLSAAALEGRRAAPVTGTAAYVAGLGVIRAAAPDVVLVGLDAPLLPSAGLLDVVRTAPDGDPLQAARAAAARSFASGRLWWADPGPVRVGEGTLAEAHGAVVAAVLGAGAWTLSDLASLDDERLGLALRAEAVALRGAPPIADDPLADGPPARAVLADGAVALLNLGAAPLEVDGPGGTELLDGEEAAPGPRVLPPGDGEIWR